MERPNEMLFAVFRGTANSSFAFICLFVRGWGNRSSSYFFVRINSSLLSKSRSRKFQPTTSCTVPELNSTTEHGSSSKKAAAPSNSWSISSAATGSLLLDNSHRKELQRSFCLRPCYLSARLEEQRPYSSSILEQVTTLPLYQSCVSSSDEGVKRRNVLK